LKLTELHHWRDPVFRSAASQMALDEALFLWSVETGVAAARFYHWDRPALTTGYFHRSDPAASVRRLTGGGLVEHGEDLTFLLALPARSEAAITPGPRRYQWIHEALAASLAAAAFPVSLAPTGIPASIGPCFTNTVPWDLLDPKTGEKIGGGAQRRSRGAVIHQGSLRLPRSMRHPEAHWIDHFLDQIAMTASPLSAEVRERLLAESLTRESSRYGNEAWNRLPEFGK